MSKPGSTYINKLKSICLHVDAMFDKKDGRKRSRLFACHRAYRVGAEIFHITSKTFVQPQIRPPIQRYQVTKPGNYF